MRCPCRGRRPRCLARYRLHTPDNINSNSS
jgi:hypothetical protein